MNGWKNIILNKHARSIKTGALRHNIVWDTKIGDYYRKTMTNIGLYLLKKGRQFLKKGSGRCTWCGRDCGFYSSISHKGLRCIDCEKY